MEWSNFSPKYNYDFYSQDLHSQDLHYNSLYSQDIYPALNNENIKHETMNKTADYDFVSLSLHGDKNSEVFTSAIFDLNQLVEIEDIDVVILDEHNNEIATLEQELVDAAEIMSYLAEMVDQSKEQLDLAHDNIVGSETNVDTGTEDLFTGYTYESKTRKIFRDVAIITGGVIVGSLGLITGPITGIITLGLGIGAATGTVKGIRKWETKHGTLTLKRVKQHIQIEHVDFSQTKSKTFFEKHFPKTYAKIKSL